MYKVQRTNEDILREVALQIRDMKDPRVQEAMLTVVSADLSSDYSYCKVYVSSLLGFEKAKEAVKVLNAASGFLRKQVGANVKMRYTPEFEFIPDNSAEHAAHIAKLLKGLEK